MGEQVLLKKAEENLTNAGARKAAEEADAADAADRVNALINDKKGNIKDLNDSIAELKQLEMDVAGLRAEIDRYTKLLEAVPDPSKGFSLPTAAKKRRTETTTVVTETTTEVSGSASMSGKRTKTTTTTA